MVVDEVASTGASRDEEDSRREKQKKRRPRKCLYRDDM